MKVRATQDGVYAGYYRVEGEIFEIDSKSFQVKDQDGKTAYELDDKGNAKKDQKGNLIPRMGSFFSKRWMEQVSEDEMVTNDYPPFQLPTPYRIAKKRQGDPKSMEPLMVQPPLASVI